jgi:pentose-5-phosphate-3-epimerase
VKKQRNACYREDELRVLPIEVDGGINDKTIVEAKNAGATRFITTSFLFGGSDPKTQYDLLQNLVSK